MLVLVATMIRVAGLTTDGEVVRSCEIKRTASLWVSLLQGRIHGSVLLLL